MRALGAVAGLGFAVAGIAVAGAADLPISGHRDYVSYAAIGVRAAPLVIYDYEPGVVVRAYWLAPWRHRHYFPATGKRPRIGRVEHLSARSVHKSAKTYRRFWSTSSAFLPDLPRGRMRDIDVMPAPSEEPPLK